MIHNLNSFGVTYIGVRTRHIDAMKQFAQEVLGYNKTQDDGDFVAFNTPQGQRFELHVEDTPDKQFYPLDGAVSGFEVPDFDKAVAWAKENNLELFPEGTGEGKGGTKWAHFRGPDGNVYEFVHHPSITAGGKLE
ncbi:MAG TPA: VOC family protein [Candidatus Saccharimonadales bacterium]|nr:VOC family protein [Candidatus Saccharimonadales bacterium]